MASMTANELREMERKKAASEEGRQQLYVAPPPLTPAEAAKRTRERYRLDTERFEGREARRQKPSPHSDPELWGL